MKILVRHAHSGQYVDLSGNWTTVVSEAKDFSAASDALKFCQERQLKDAEMVMIFDNPPSECRVPVERVLVSNEPGEVLPRP